MSTLTVTAKGQVTFKRDLLRHLGIEPGQQVEVVKSPGGRVTLRAAAPTGTIEDFIGCLAGKTRKTATLEEISEAASAGWSARP
jgi:antitoxin PrlF